MNFMLNMELPKAGKLIYHHQRILSVGSCFTEHISNALTGLKFNVLQNPNGILFDPISVASSLLSYIPKEQNAENELFQLDEIWNNWQYHSRYSGTDKQLVIDKIKASHQEAHLFLKEAEWIIITLGSAFSYRLKERSDPEIVVPWNFPHAIGWVANCHRAPAQWFEKHLISTDVIIERLDYTLCRLLQYNPNLNIIFTISPVRHVRDGIVDNNRSKARLVESVHHLVDKFDRLFYFPSYELVIDVLRDYRFYAEDMVHPNYLATEFVLAKFIQTFMGDETIELINEIKKINIARKHRAIHPHTKAHQEFLKNNLKKLKSLQKQFEFLNFDEEIDYFSNQLNTSSII